MSLEELVERDIVMVLGLWPGLSYFQVVEQLGAYDASLVVQGINSLCKSGRIRMTDEGLVAVQKPIDAEKPATSAVREVLSAAKVSAVAEERKPAQSAREIPGIRASKSASAPVSAASRSMPLSQGAHRSPAVSSKAVVVHDPGVPSTVLAGTVLASSSVEMLGFEGPAVVAMLEKGMSTVADLVGSLGVLRELLPEEALKKVVAKLVKLSGQPALKLERSQVESLKRCASSQCFYFDWLGVLCTELPQDASAKDVLRLAESEGLAVSKHGAQSSSAIQGSAESVEVAKALRAALGLKRLSVKEDSFDVFMVPTVEEWFETGECESKEEALESGLDLVLKSSQTTLACYGVLRDFFYDAKLKDRAKKGAVEERFVGEACFVVAAKDLAKDDPAATFDVRQGKISYAF